MICTIEFSLNTGEVIHAFMNPNNYLKFTGLYDLAGSQDDDLLNSLWSFETDRYSNVCHNGNQEFSSVLASFIYNNLQIKTAKVKKLEPDEHVFWAKITFASDDTV